MVQQAYVHRLALGRSAFELPERSTGDQESGPNSLHNGSTFSSSPEPSTGFIQEFNTRGHPQNPVSRSSVRRNLRAHNEVLTTVDVCARIDSNGRDLELKRSRHNSNELDEAICDENEVGFWLSFADEVVCLLTTTVTTNMRKRFTTFDIYSGVPLLAIPKIELARQGFPQIFFAGELANSVFYILDGFIDSAIEMGRDYLLNRFCTPQHRKSQRRINTALISTGITITKCAVFCAIFPLQVYAALQRLNLISVWPLFPNPFKKSYFLPLIPPPFPQAWSRSTTISWIIALATSPVVSYLSMQIFADTVRPTLHRYSRALLPRPDNPDASSYRIMEDDSFGSAAPVMTFPRRHDTVQLEWSKDIHEIRSRLHEFKKTLRNGLRRFIGRGPVSDTTILPWCPPTYTSRRFPTQASTQRQRRDTADVGFDSSAPSEQPVQEEEAVVPPSFPLLTPTSSSEEEDMATTNAANVRIRTRTGSTSTLHMDVEFNTSNRDGPVRTSSFAASPHGGGIVERAVSGNANYILGQHRVTALSLHAWGTWSTYMAAALMAIVRGPLDSLYYRSVARAYLSTQQPSSKIIQHIYPLETWFGLGLHSGLKPALDYISKAMFCIVAELFIQSQAWRLGCAVAMYTGRHWYDWGKL